MAVRDDTPVVLLFMKLIIDPAMRYLHNEVKLSSREHQIRSTAAGCERMQIRPVVRAMLGSGQWPLLVAASGEQDKLFLKRIQQVCDPSRYKCAPPSYKTLRLRRLLFRMISRETARACPTLLFFKSVCVRSMIFF